MFRLHRERGGHEEGVKLSISGNKKMLFMLDEGRDSREELRGYPNAKAVRKH